MDSFNLLIQRYVTTIWKSSPETNKKRLQLILDLPTLPEGAPQTYFSTFAIIKREFQENSRPVDLYGQIGGYPDVKIAVRNLYLNQTEPEKSRSNGLQPYANKFLLTTGCEGTGKSLFPKALNKMLKDYYGNKYEYFRLPLADMLRKYGAYTAVLVTTILEHIRENEKQGIATLLHADNLEYLVPQHQRPKDIDIHSSSTHQEYYQFQTPPSTVEFNYMLQTLGPIVEAVRQFGKDVGANSHHTIVYGESRLPRAFLPEGIARTFRRTFNLDNPSVDNVGDILRVQINATREFAQSTGRDPFAPDITSHLKEMAKHAVGLNGRLIQQALLHIAAKKTVEGTDLPISHEDICSELDNTRLTRNLTTNGPENRRLGFHLPHQES